MANWAQLGHFHLGIVNTVDIYRIGGFHSNDVWHIQQEEWHRAFS